MVDSRQPRLSIHCEVEGLTDQWRPLMIDELSRVDAFEPSHINQVVPPLYPKATIFSVGEFNNLHNELGITPTKAYLKELGSYVINNLSPAAHKDMIVDTLPAKVSSHAQRKAPRKVLIVGAAQYLVAERSRAKQAVLRFHRLDSFPKGVLLEDDYVTGIAIARSDRLKRAVMVDYLAAVINQGRLLPPKLTLKPVKSDVTS